MKKILPTLFAFLLLAENGFCQENPVIKAFPNGTILHANLPYNNDSHDKHLLDIYLPAGSKGKRPLVIFLHGGGWISNDKYADIGYMTKTIGAMINSGFAIASIDYRFGTEAVFPAQIQDCNRAVSFLYDNADKYGLDRERFVVMGFSAGAHLAAMLGLSLNNDVNAFFMPGSSKLFKIRGVIDYYGPSELILFPRNDDSKSPESILIGATPLARPDLARAASPVTYVDKNDPEFLIIHGEKDDLVSLKHSQLLHSWLNVNGVSNELITVKDAPHFGAMFDVDEIRIKVISFLKKQFQ